jgi:Uma2 family endonuclease
MSTLPHAFVTPDEYLRLDRESERRSEYYEGGMFATAGAARAHIQIVANVMRDIGVQIENRPCYAFSNEMRVRASAAREYTYPDVIVVCGEPRFLDQREDTLLNPSLIIEVLSKSSEAYDRGVKFEKYGELPSLREYLLLDSRRVKAELFRRMPDGTWFTAGRRT